MNNKYFQRIIILATIILLAMPLSLKAQTTQQFSNEELAQMLAPIALYPDALLSQMLIAASYPFEVVEADRWMSRNPGLAEEALDNALSQKDWDVSVLSLCHYPKVLHMMSENLNWTAKLGDAFVNQEQDVMDTVQELRARASEQGNLVTTNEQEVIVEERIIRIEPTYQDYLYVPVYDPLVVFGPWWYPAFLPFPIFYPGVTVVGPRIVFGPRLFIGFGVIGWSAFNWHDHNVVIMNLDRTRRFYRHADVYHRSEHVQWKPDHQKRVVQERKWRESPRFQPSVKSPRAVPEGGFKRGADVIVPPRSKTSPVGPRVINKDKRPSLTPKEIDKGETPAIGGPRVIDKGKHPEAPKVIDRDKRPDGTPIVTDKKGSTPYIGGPRIIDRGKAQPQPQSVQTQPKQTVVKPQTKPVQSQPQLQQQLQFKHQSKPVQSQPRMIDKNVPAVQNRGSVGAGTVKAPQTLPRVENKEVTRTVKGAERGNPNDQRDFSGAGGESRGNRNNGGGFGGKR